MHAAAAPCCRMTAKVKTTTTRCLVALASHRWASRGRKRRQSPGPDTGIGQACSRHGPVDSRPPGARHCVPDALRLVLLPRRVAHSRTLSAASLLGQAAIQLARAAMADVGPLAAGSQKRLATMLRSVEGGEANARLQAIKPRLFWQPRLLRL